MKKGIKQTTAFMLVFVMLLSALPQVTLFAAPNTALGFEIQRKMLKEDATGLKVDQRDTSSDETALVKWSLQTAGKYELSYYIEVQEGTQIVTKQVRITVDSTGTGSSGLKIEIVDSSGTNSPQSVDYVERIFNNANFTWADSSTKVENVLAINKALQLGAAARDSQEFNIKLTNMRINLGDGSQDNLRLRFKVVGEELYVFTNGITKGNITPFTLNNITSGTQLIAKGELFNGPKDYVIEPTHLYKDTDGSLKSLDYIEDITQVRPGSVPGVKVSFAQIKELVSGKFTYIDSLAGQTRNVTLQLGTRYTLNDISNALRLDFDPKSGASVKVNLKDTYTNVVHIDDNQVALYLSASTLSGGSSPSVLKWDELTTSMIVDGSFQYGTQAERYWPTNKGYTYLGYSFNKTSNNQVQLTIQPYNIKARATYSIYVLSHKDTETTTPSVVYEYDPNKTDTTDITAIVPVQSQSYFKIVVQIDSNTFESQMVYYDPDAYTAVPEVTQITGIENIYAVPSEDVTSSGAQPQAVGLDIEWRAPQNIESLLQTGNLYYELLLRKNTDDRDPVNKPSGSSSDGYAAYSKIIEVSLNNEGEVVVQVVGGTAGEAYNQTPELRYNAVNGTFTMETVSLMNFGTSHSAWEQLEIVEDHFNVNTSDSSISNSVQGYLANIAGTRADSLTGFIVPGTYYLSFRTVLASKVDKKPIVYSTESNMVAISIDNSKEIIPVPSIITGEDTSNADKTEISQKISIRNVDILSYVKMMLEPARLYLYQDEAKTTGRYSGEYEVYLYQKSDNLASTIKKVESGELTPLVPTENNLEINLNDETKQIEKLRQGDVIPILLSSDALLGTGNESFNLKGLDPNEVYYVQVRVKLNPWRESLQDITNGKIKPRYSLFSKEFTFTTTTVPLPPSPEDKIPPTPEDIWIVEQPNNTTATIGWAPAKFEADEDISKTYYEFVRSDLQLPAGELSKTVEELVALSDGVIGFRSDSPTESNPFMSTYTSKSKTWTNLDPLQMSNNFKLTDDTLQPNAVYYYYARTVCIINGKAVKSSWIMVPVTTEPVLPPINLKVELPKNYSHEPTEEIVISFDAPVPSVQSVINNDYRFDIAIQGEMDDAYSTTKYSVVRLESKEDSSLTPQGYTHFVYKITGLKPNKRYYIKVRVEDRTKELANNEVYPTSLYCDPVTTRTEYDEEESEKDNKYEEYLKKYEAEAEKLRRKAYWVVEDGQSYKYRESYINTELNLQSEYHLVGGADTSRLYYYMPASLFTLEKGANTVLTITIGDYSASIRPFSLTEETEEIKEAIALVNERNLENYYVGITFELIEQTGKVNNETVISPQIMIDMELVYTKSNDRDIEESIMSALNNLIIKEKEYVITALEKKIYNGVIADDVLQKIIETAISEIEVDHMKEVSRIMSRTNKKVIPINTLEKPILLLASAEYSAVNGYYFANGWTAVTAYAAGGRFAIEANQFGLYIFTGQPSLISTVPSLAPYQGFIAQYNLTDFFVLDSYMIQTAATKEQVYGALGRIMGASRGSDYSTFLKNKGIKGIAAIGATSTIRQDEAIYVVMQGYEQLHKRTIKSIVIKNKQSVQNIAAFQTIYRDYVYAAVELKIVSNPNSKVMPSKQMTVEEMIIMLYKIQA